MRRLRTGASILRYAVRDGYVPEDRRHEIEMDDERPDQDGRAGPSKRGGLRLLRPSDLKARPDPPSLVKGLLFQGQFSTLFGPPNVGKTFVALDIALHVATGRDWRGRTSKHGLVVYVALEGVGGIRKRFEAWCLHHDLSPEDIPIVFGEGALNLREDKRALATLVSDALAEAKHYEMPLVMIVIDTLARAMSGGDENSPADMGALIRGADEIRMQTGAHLCLVHHVGKDASRGPRGHSSLEGASDTMISIAEKDHRKFATVTKQKDGEVEGSWSFALERVTLNRKDDDGEVITSAVAVPPSVPFDFQDENLNSRQEQALAVLRQLILERFEADLREDAVGASNRGGISIAHWNAELRNSGWPPPSDRGRRPMRTSDGQLRQGENERGGQAADNSRTNESFERECRRMRQALVRKGIIAIDGDFVSLAKR